MGPVRAKRYGVGTGHCVGVVRGPHVSPCAASTVNIRGPLGARTAYCGPGSVGTACTMPVPAPYGHVYWVVSTRTLRNLDSLPSLGFCSDYVTNPLLSRGSQRKRLLERIKLKKLIVIK